MKSCALDSVQSVCILRVKAYVLTFCIPESYLEICSCLS